jgi:hypothetical protein
MATVLPEYDRHTLYPHRQALSSTQFLDYEHSPGEFYLRWVLGVRGAPSLPRQIGRIFSALYADRTLDYRALLSEAGAPARIGQLFAEALQCLPVLQGGQPETPLYAQYGQWELRATLDDFVRRHSTIVENKTGTTVWDQERVNGHDQLTFQAFVHWQKYGIPPRTIIVNWVDCRPSATQLIHTLQTTRSLRHLEQFAARVDTVIAHLEAEHFTRPVEYFSPYVREDQP